MNNTQIQLVKLLNKSLIKEKIDLDKNIDLSELISEAKNNRVEALIYSAISEDSKNTIDSELLNDLKKTTFFSGVQQLNHIKEVSRILNRFKNKKIDVLVLKGLVIRDLYPNPTLRTMSDADIVVSEENLETSKSLMIELGYSEYESSPSHFVYVKPGCLPIELHWNLADEHFFKDISVFEEDMWPNVIDVNIGGSDALGMSLEDFAIFQVIHMAKHFVYRGFGIRHLVDFVLLVRQKGNDINWSSFIDRCFKYGIGKFTIAMFAACNKLFNLEVPSEVSSKGKCSDKYINAFIDDIFAGGVHGRHDFTSAVASEFAYTADKENGKSDSVFMKFVRYIFPSVENMSDKYSYAKNNRLLVPIAWIHHLFAGVFNKDYSLKDKLKFTTAVVGVSKKRNDLIEWMEL